MKEKKNNNSKNWDKNEETIYFFPLGRGYQPIHGHLDPKNPPRGGSGVPPKYKTPIMEEK